METNRQSGMTLIELACSVAVLSVLAGIAAPGFSAWQQRAGATRLVNGLTADIALARMSAISRNQTAVICPSIDARQCSAQADWTDGWLVYLDRNRDRIHQPDEPVLSTEQARRVRGLSFTSSAARPVIRLLPSGYGYGTNLTVTACLNGSPYALLVMNNAGRVRVDRKPSASAAGACATGQPKT